MNEQIIRAIALRALIEHPFPNTMFPPSPYYRFLKHLAAEMQPQLSVVLGVCGGGCCLHLAQGHAKGRVIGIDLVNDYPEQVTYIKQNHANFTFWLGDSVEAAFEIFKGFGYVNLLFIDTTHEYEQTMREYDTWRQYLSKNAAVCLDDLFRPGMDRVWNELPEPKVRLDALHDSGENGGGFGVIWSKK